MPTGTDTMLLALDNPPPTAQWVGVIATLAGAWLAWWAWWRAKGAREQARLATEAAVRLGRGAQMRDLIADLQELQALVARKNLPALVDKCGRLQGRIAGFRDDAYNDLTTQARARLEAAIWHLEAIARVASGSEQLRKEERIPGIQIAYRRLEVALNSVAGELRGGLRGE